MKNLRAGSLKDVCIATFRSLGFRLLNQNEHIVGTDVEGSAQIVIGNVLLPQECAGTVLRLIVQ